MALPPEVEIALRILQVTGLVLPVVFIALRPFYDPTNDQSERQRSSGSGLTFEDGEIKFDFAPLAVRSGVVVVSLFGLAAVAACIKVILFLGGISFAAIALVLLAAGIIALGVLFFLIRARFRGTADAV